MAAKKAAKKKATKRRPAPSPRRTYQWVTEPLTVWRLVEFSGAVSHYALPVAEKLWVTIGETYIGRVMPLAELSAGTRVRLYTELEPEDPWDDAPDRPCVTESLPRVWFWTPGQCLSKMEPAQAQTRGAQTKVKGRYELEVEME